MSDGEALQALGEGVEQQEQGVAVDAVREAGAVGAQDARGLLGELFGGDAARFDALDDSFESCGVAGVKLGALAEAIERGGRCAEHSRTDSSRAEDADGDALELQLHP